MVPLTVVGKYKSVGCPLSIFQNINLTDCFIRVYQVWVTVFVHDILTPNPIPTVIVNCLPSPCVHRICTLYCSGQLADRTNLRYFLTVGMFGGCGYDVMYVIV